MTRAPDPLLRVWRTPDAWNLLTDQARGELLRDAQRCHLAASLASRMAALGIPVGNLALRDRLAAACVVADEHQRRLRFAVRLARQAMATATFPVVVLKGGAYLFGGFPNAAGRLTSDLDLLVPEADLARAEAIFHEAGWRSQSEDDYEDSYYRQWMHELPPLVHPHHNITIDLHHNIAPRTGRLRVDAAALLDQATPLDTAMPLLRLGDADLVLHLCVHLFHDGEFHTGLRELADLDGVLRTLAQRPGFWDALLARAAELGLRRPLAYGVHFCHRLLGTPVPDATRRALRGAEPPWPFGKVLRAAISQALVPGTSDRLSPAKQAADALLVMRGHWLRMPPTMLLRHLLMQARRRGGFKTKEAAARHAG